MIKKEENELSFIDAREFMNTNSFKNQVRLYSIVGGNIQLLKIANHYQTLNEFVYKDVFDINSFFFIHLNTYLKKLSKLDQLIITAIGIGNTKPTAISNNINIKELIIRKALVKLEKKSIIRKEVPLMDGSINNLTDEIYLLNKNNFKFYFNFIYPYLKNTKEFNKIDALSHFIAVFNYQYQGKIFEEICKELFLVSIKSNKFDWINSSLGSYWNEDNSIEIDIISKDMSKNILFLGECKFFKSKPVDMRIYHHLKEKAKLINETNIIYGLFSITGFSKEIIKLSKNTNHLILFNKFEMLKFD